MATLSPLYTYIQALVTNGTGFTVHLNGGDRLTVNSGNASITAAGALVLQVGNLVNVANESSIVHIEHNGPAMK